MKKQTQHNHITIFESALFRTTSTVIGWNESVIIFDPNWLPAEIDEIHAFVNKYYHGKKQYLIFTHSDFDHIIGYGRFTDAIAIASTGFRDNPDKAAVIRQITDFDDMYYIRRAYPIMYPDVDIIIYEDGQKLEIDGITLEFYLAPGHVRDGMFILIPEKKVWVAGDYLSNIEIPLIDHDFQYYRETLNKALKIYHKYPQINVLIPGHGDYTHDRQIIIQRIENDQTYLNLISDDSGLIDDTKLTNLIHEYGNPQEMIKAHLRNIALIKKEIQ